MITSLSNEKVKDLRKLLTQKKQRLLHQRYVLESAGPGRIAELDGIAHIYTSDESYTSNLYPVTYLSTNVIGKLTTTGSTPLFLVVLDMNIREALPRHGKFIFADNIQDPGNLGAIIRTAAAFSYDGIVFTKGTVDPFSPKTVRSSAGCVTSVPVYMIDTLQLQDRHLIVTDPSGAQLDGYRPPGDFVLVFSNEGAGVSSRVLACAEDRIAIPTAIDSLNVSVAAGIIIYELAQG